jgi:hypothetical protein
MVIVLSSSDNLILDRAGVKRKAGQGSRTVHTTLSVSKTLSYNSQGCAVSFKQWSEVECKKFLTEINYKNTENVTSTEVILL